MNRRVITGGLIFLVLGLWAEFGIAQQGLFDATPLITTPILTQSPTALGYRPMTQLDPASIKIEPFTITPTLSTVLGHDDNVGLRSTNKNSSAFFGLSPAVAVAVRGSPTDLYTAGYRGNYGRYADSSKDNYDDHFLDLNASNDWSTRMRSLVRYDYAYMHDPRGTTASAVNAPDRWDLNALRGSLAYGAKSAPGQIEVDAGIGRKHYITNRDITALKDYDQANLAGAFFYRIAPATQALAQVRTSRFDYQQDAAGLDSTEMRYLVGLKWEATAKTQGMVKLGYMTKNFSNPAHQDISSPSYEAGVTWAPVTYSTAYLSASRGFYEQYAGGSAVVSDQLLVMWNHDWNSRVRSTVTVLEARDDLKELGRTDDRQNLGLKVSYGVRRWLRLGGEVRRESRSSDVPGVDYTKNLVLFTLDASL